MKKEIISDVFIYTFGKKSEKIANELKKNGYGKAVLATKENPIAYDSCPELFILADFSADFSELKNYIASLPNCSPVVFILSEDENHTFDCKKMGELGATTLLLSEKPIEQQVQFCYEFISHYLTRTTHYYLFDIFGDKEENSIWTLDRKKIAKLDFKVNAEKKDLLEFTNRIKTERCFMILPSDMLVTEIKEIRDNATKNGIELMFDTTEDNKSIVYWLESI